MTKLETMPTEEMKHSEHEEHTHKKPSKDDSLFADLRNLGKVRSWKQAVIWYIIYVLITLLIAAIVGGTVGGILGSMEFSLDDIAAVGAVLWVIVAVASVVVVGLLLLWKKNSLNIVWIVAVIIFGVLAYFFGGFVGFIPLAILSMQKKGFLKELKN